MSPFCWAACDHGWNIHNHAPTKCSGKFLNRLCLFISTTPLQSDLPYKVKNEVVPPLSKFNFWATKILHDCPVWIQNLRVFSGLHVEPSRSKNGRCYYITDQLACLQILPIRYIRPVARTALASITALRRGAARCYSKPGLSSLFSGWRHPKQKSCSKHGSFQSGTPTSRAPQQTPTCNWSTSAGLGALLLSASKMTSY